MSNVGNEEKIEFSKNRILQTTFMVSTVFGAVFLSKFVDTFKENVKNIRMQVTFGILFIVLLVIALYSGSFGPKKQRPMIDSQIRNQDIELPEMGR